MKANLSEAEFTRMVIELAKLRGWRVAHFRTGMNRRGKWSTPMQGHVGFPDLILIRRDRLVVAELKVGRNILTMEQQDWIDDFGYVAEIFVWYPADWKEIEEVLA